jgi:hypothetical protein
MREFCRGARRLKDGIGLDHKLRRGRRGSRIESGLFVRFNHSALRLAENVRKNLGDRVRASPQPELLVWWIPTR